MTALVVISYNHRHDVPFCHHVLRFHHVHEKALVVLETGVRLQLLSFTQLKRLRRLCFFIIVRIVVIVLLLPSASEQGGLGVVPLESGNFGIQLNRAVISLTVLAQRLDLVGIRRIPIPLKKHRILSKRLHIIPILAVRKFRVIHCRLGILRFRLALRHPICIQVFLFYL